MANNKVDRITSREKDFNQWYTDVVKQSGLVQYGLVKGSIAFGPYATKIWNKIKNYLNEEFEKLEVQEVMLPSLFPLSLLQKEKENIEGFAPELFSITKLQGREIKDPLVLRPTSEIPFANYFKGSINTYKDLPLKLNQWANVFRMENNTRPFLRNSEFMWQEGHTSHRTPEESKDFAKKILDVYLSLIEDKLLIANYSGKKPESEKFPAAKTTYTIEAMMQNGYALQSATTHDLVDNFSKVYDVKFDDSDNTKKNVFQTSWGMTTRIIGGMIMAHSDDNGLVLPPWIAPTVVKIIEISANKDENISKTANKIKSDLSGEMSVEIDRRDMSFGKKSAEAEILGIPVRIEVGPRGLKDGYATVVRRDTFKKEDVKLENITNYVKELVKTIEVDMKKKNIDNLSSSTVEVSTYEEFKSEFSKGNKFVKTNFCADEKYETQIKEELGVTPRVILENEKISSDKCFISGAKAKSVVIWAKAY